MKYLISLVVLLSIPVLSFAQDVSLDIKTAGSLYALGMRKESTSNNPFFKFLKINPVDGASTRYDVPADIRIRFSKNLNRVFFSTKDNVSVTFLNTMKTENLITFPQGTFFVGPPCLQSNDQYFYLSHAVISNKSNDLVYSSERFSVDGSRRIPLAIPTSDLILDVSTKFILTIYKRVDTGKFALRAFNLDGTPIAELSADQVAPMARISSNSDRLAYLESDGNLSRVICLDIATSRKTVFLQGSSDENPSSICWSPNSDILAVSVGPSDKVVLGRRQLPDLATAKSLLIFFDSKGRLLHKTIVNDNILFSNIDW